jgi:hypothetical protein
MSNPTKLFVRKKAHSPGYSVQNEVGMEVSESWSHEGQGFDLRRSEDDFGWTR